jgi:hypothetical protein
LAPLEEKALEENALVEEEKPRDENDECSGEWNGRTLLLLLLPQAWEVVVLRLGEAALRKAVRGLLALLAALTTLVQRMLQGRERRGLESGKY